MIRRFLRHEGGGPAAEFALVLPMLATLMVTGVSGGLAVWTKNIIQDAAQESARCAAIGSSVCASATVGCDSGSGVVCYTESLAAARGCSSVTASMIAVNANLTSGGVSFTTVTITYPFSLVGYSYSLVAVGSFPNAS